MADSYATAQFDDKSVGTSKSVRVSGITLIGTDAGNYTFNTTATATATVSARPLTVVATGASKVYDGTTAATVTLSDDRVTGDALADSYTSAAFGDKNAGTAKPISISGISIGGADADNYSYNTAATATADITVRALTVGATGADKVYDGTRVAAVTLSDNRVSGDRITDTYAGAAFDSKNIGTAKPVSVTGIAISGANAGNYVCNTAAATTAAITAYTLSAAATGVNKVYDGTTAAAVVLGDDHVSGDVVITSYTSATFADKDVGAGKTVRVVGIALSGADASNYVCGTTTATTADITPRTLTVSGAGMSRVYDGTATATVTLSDNRIAGDHITDSYAGAAFADKNVAIGKAIRVTGILVSGPDAGDYRWNASAGTTADITPRDLHVSATADNKVYDGTTAAVAHLGDDRVAGDALTDSYLAASFGDKNAGTGKAVTVSGIAISGADAANYDLVNNTAATTADITRAVSATGLTASAATPLYGVDSMTFTATVTATPGDFTGNVDFYDNTTHTDLGSVAVVNGVAALNTASLAVGAHAIIATYGGDGNFLSSPGTAGVNVIPPASLVGTVFEDFNDDGQVDFGEQGIAGVTVALVGTDDLGRTVSQSQQTDSNGLYAFTNLRPGDYTLTESQPAAYGQGIDSIGTAGGTVNQAADRFTVALAMGLSGQRYNYGERPAAGSAVQKGQAAGITFWTNKKGQDLINALNGGPKSTQLGDWLAATLPNVYGAGAGPNNLAGKSNASVAVFVQQQSKKALDAEVLATALSVYVTNATLDPTNVAGAYGFTVAGDGAGVATANVGTNGDALGVRDNSTLTLLDLLLATNAKTANGVLYYGANAPLLAHADNVYAAVLKAGGIH